MGAAALLLLLFLQQDGEAGGMRPVRTDRTWSLWVHLEPCDLSIDRIDTMKIDVENSPVATTAGRLLIFQWNQPDPGRGASISSLLFAMSRERYKARIFYRYPDGREGVMFLYFSPYGASRRPIEALSLGPYAEGDEGRPISRIEAWMGTHEFSPRSPYNPERDAFSGEFGRLASHFDSRMEMTIRLGSCPAPTPIR